jgi:predicted metal-dependent HD superfamily phosphohydrolase
LGGGERQLVTVFFQPIGRVEAPRKPSIGLTATNMPPLLQPWQKMWKALGVTVQNDVLLKELMRRYSEPHRKYHTLQHLDECFAKYAEVRNDASHPEEIEFALWFHDAIYDVWRQDNELKSANWARAEALAAGISKTVAERLYDLVMITRHGVCAKTNDEKILADVDLSILGADPGRFFEYENQIRAEYSWVPDTVFREKRLTILQGFLSRPRIFKTAHFLSRYEAKARTNLRRFIASLGG